MQLEKRLSRQIFRDVVPPHALERVAKDGACVLPIGSVEPIHL
jgi:hypothetical protein